VPAVVFALLGQHGALHKWCSVPAYTILIADIVVSEIVMWRWRSVLEDEIAAVDR
jgi:hypothetical protein